MLQVHYPISFPEQRIILSNQTFNNELRDYLKTTFHVDFVYIADPQLAKVTSTFIQIQGPNEQAQFAREYLTSLFSSLTNELFGDHPGKTYERDFLECYDEYI